MGIQFNQGYSLVLVLLLGCVASDLRAGTAATSEWVNVGPEGKLKYKTSPAGDQIMDFSAAGYQGGGVALPSVPVKRTVQTSGQADEATAIQAAIEAVSALPLENGFRGAVLLGPGDFTCSKTISMPKSGVVLRGTGSGSNGTTIKMTGPRHSAITIGRGRSRGGPSLDENEPAEGREQSPEHEFIAAQTTIAEAYVPAGATHFSVADPTGFAAGDFIIIRRPTTAAWIRFMQMDTLKRDGRPQTWIGQSRSEAAGRKIIAISGKDLMLEIPLPDSYDAKYLNPPGTTVTKVQPPAAVNHVGVEHLHIQCPPLEISYGQAPYSAIRIGGDDCWVKDVYCEETMNSTSLSGKRITMQDVVVTHTYPNLGASKPTDFSLEGSQILLEGCRITGDNMYFVWTAGLCPGPNVLLNCTFRGHGSRIQPHMRWSTGLLVDNCTVPDGGIDFANRGVAGSGHGWTMGWAVAWNCIANTYVVQQPPGSMNWAIGCVGRRVQTARYFDAGPILPEGTFDSHESPVAPQSLYLAQLNERLGPQSLRNLGYAANTRDSFPGKSTPRSPELSTGDDRILGPDLALHRPVNAGNVRARSREFSGENAVDGDRRTFWATDDNAGRATLELDLEGPVEMNALVLEEADGHIGQVQEYKVEAQVNSDWTLLSRGTSLGARMVAHFPRVTAWKVRLTILKAEPYPAIRKFGLYLE